MAKDKVVRISAAAYAIANKAAKENKRTVKAQIEVMVIDANAQTVANKA